MKLLIIGIDAMIPEILFPNIELYPNMAKLCKNGIHASYDAYAYGYGSIDNWISLYTGLTPNQHKVKGNRLMPENRHPNYTDYKKKDTFWNKIGKEKGMSFGVWKGLSTTPPEDINGYMVSGEANYEICNDDPYINFNPVFTQKNSYLKDFIEGKPNEFSMPKTPEDFGLSWEEILQHPTKANDIMKDDYFEDSLKYLFKELKYYRNNILNIQNKKEVDVLFFYTPILDFIQHFQMHDAEHKVIKKAMKIIDDFIGKIGEDLNPENTIVMSDHGIKALSDLFPNTPIEIQKEAFGWSNKSVWLDNGSICSKARNNGFLSALHSIKGCFIASGKLFKTGKINQMRTVDFYPTLLELFDVKVQNDRQGYVLDIFKNKEIVNKDRLLNEKDITFKHIAIIQTMEVPEFNRIINETFLDNRFTEITIIGFEKYKNIFLANSRISDFISLEDYKINKNILSNYDKVITSYRNLRTDELEYIEIF